MFKIDITYLDKTTEEFKTIEWIILPTVLKIELGVGEGKFRYIPLSSIKYFNSSKE